MNVFAFSALSPDPSTSCEKLYPKVWSEYYYGGRAVAQVVIKRRGAPDDTRGALHRRNKTKDQHEG